MPKDNRKILSSVRITGKPLFRDGIEDELAAELDQQRLDHLKREGVLAGDWKSTKNTFVVTGNDFSKQMSANLAESGAKVVSGETDEFKPLPLDETMQRFQEFDFSDEVVRSMQFHREAIKEKVGGNAGNSSTELQNGKSDSENDDSNKSVNDSDSANNSDSDSDADEEFPENFPARSKFIKADKTFAQVKEMTREQLIEIDQIAEKTADEVLAYFANSGK